MTNGEEFCILLLRPSLREAEPAPAFKPVVSQSCSVITQVEAHQSRLDGGRSLCLRLIHHQSPDRTAPMERHQRKPRGWRPRLLPRGGLRSRLVHTSSSI